MKMLTYVLMMSLPCFVFCQEQKLKGRYYELSEPTKVEYTFKGIKFEYHANAGVVEFYGKGKYELINDSIVFYFDTLKNESSVEYAGQKHADKESEFQITVIECNSKMGLVGAKVQFYSDDNILIHETHLDENGVSTFKTLEPIEYIIISYIGNLDLKLNIDNVSNYHQFKVLWKTTETSLISGEVWKYEIKDIERRSFKLKKEEQFFKYKKKLF